MKRLFEFRVYDIMKDDDNREFLNKVKDENLDLYDRFMSLVGNKGLEIAKKKYLEFDPSEVKRVKREKKKQIRKQSEYDYLMGLYSNILGELTEYLKISPLKDVLNIITQEKNLKNWKKQYRTGNLKISNSYITSFSESKPIDTVVITPRIYKNPDILEFREDSFTIYQYVSFSRDRKNITGYHFSIKFDFDFDFEISEFEECKLSKIKKLRRTNMDINYLQEILEKFKYYMSNKYEEDWKIEQEAKKYNM